MLKRILLLAFSIVYSFINAQSPKNVILFIGDGFGIAPKTATRMAMGQGTEGKRYYNDPGFHVLELDKLKYTGMATTHSLNSWTTDSAPGATVYSTGKKIDNEVLAFDVQTNQPIETILEAAKKQGYAVGLVTTTRITHATPAAFGSHIWHRDLEDYIAAQLISSTQKEYEEIFNSSPIDSLKYNPERDWKLPEPKVGVAIDVLLGGGGAHFFPASYNDTILVNRKSISLPGKRKDKANLVQMAKKRGYQYINSRDALLNIDLNQFKPGSKNKLLGLFRSSHVSYEQDRQLANEWEPSLSDMAQIAIEILKRKGGTKGFFLMVEGGRIDHLGHANAGAVSKACKMEIDSIAFSPDGGNQRLKKTAQGNIYGSDYLIKEVLGFDYAIQQGRKLLKDKTSQTLIFSTSDHECGAMALIGLSENGVIRTYAEEPLQTKQLAATPGKIIRGDMAGGIGWYPNYVTYDFQGKKYPKPASDDARHIVVTYASNPSVLGGCGGNHTPQDIWVGADDNIQGKFASKITGKGMLDNTYLTKIMAEFLGLKGF
jgi:alkaline phosphatase